MRLLSFLIFAAIAVVCAVNLVLQTHPISSALSLIGVMGSLAFVYLQLGGEFIAAAQLVVYAGAIMVLFVFVIMLLNEGKERKAKRKLWVRCAGAPLLACLSAHDRLHRPASSPAAQRACGSAHSPTATRRRSESSCSPPTCCRSKSPAC